MKKYHFTKSNWKIKTGAKKVDYGYKGVIRCYENEKYLWSELSNFTDTNRQNAIETAEWM